MWLRTGVRLNVGFQNANTGPFEHHGSGIHCSEPIDAWSYSDSWDLKGAYDYRVLSLSISYHSHSKAFDDSVGSCDHVIPQSTVFEDNDACLKFARMPKLTPRTKHIDIPYHWFRTQVERLEIHIERIDTEEQLANQFTKGLPVDAFRLARKHLIGWWQLQSKGRVNIQDSSVIYYRDIRKICLPW